MEYWLEPDELAALRREVGADPYWVPPGWKRGDPVSADGYALKAKMQVEELSKELAGVKSAPFDLQSAAWPQRKRDIKQTMGRRGYALDLIVPAEPV
ncbi:protein AMEIOTIC 1-like [Triticum urartu]|nr:protein AMEIOTIC 1-like [Triticum urartu]